MTNSRTDINEVIRLRRKGLTQKQIANRMGVTQQAISLILTKAKDKGEIGVRI